MIHAVIPLTSAWPQKDEFAESCLLKSRKFYQYRMKLCKKLLLYLSFFTDHRVYIFWGHHLQEQACHPSWSLENSLPVGGKGRCLPAEWWHFDFCVLRDWHPTENLKNQCFPAITCGHFSWSKQRQNHIIWTVFMFSKLLVFVILIDLIYTKNFSASYLRLNTLEKYWGLNIWRVIFLLLSKLGMLWKTFCLW